MSDSNPGMVMKSGAPYEIHSCIEPDLQFTTERWKAETVRGLQSMSAASRWQRFAGPVTELTDKQLDYLTDVDGKDRVAWCAVVRELSDFRGVGVSRYIRSEEEVTVAEFALAVIDEFQNQGIGQALLWRLMQSAHENGIEVLRGYVLPSNRVMLHLSRNLKADVVAEDAFVKVDISVAQTHHHCEAENSNPGTPST
ncbi:MAG: GNAT family N-acetyltransferase [Gammaproteobacteria bacterium]|nr:GNAT family N-acetyltransferase [Gammaproteobacteria bacterium]